MKTKSCLLLPTTYYLLPTTYYLLPTAYCLLLTACFLLFSPSFSLAAEGAAHGGDWKEWLWKIVNFGILVFILVKFAGKPLRDFLRQRTELIEKTMRDANAARQAAEQALAAIEDKLRLKDKEIEDILDWSKNSAKLEQELLISQGEQMKKRILEQARNSIDYELRLAKEALKAEAAEAAVGLAEEKIKERLTGEVQAALIEKSINLVESGR